MALLNVVVKSSKACGGLPAGKEVSQLVETTPIRENVKLRHTALHQDIAWFPIDKAAQTIIELTKAQTVPPILHLAHPRPIK